jgi:hypothetical protein
MELNRKQPEVLKFLRRFEIQRTNREQICKELGRAGISASTVFPDLDHLALDLDETWEKIVKKARDKEPG